MSGEAERPPLALCMDLAVWVDVPEHKGDDGSKGSSAASGKSELEMLLLWLCSSRFQRNPGKSRAWK